MMLIVPKLFNDFFAWAVLIILYIILILVYLIYMLVGILPHVTYDYIKYYILDEYTPRFSKHNIRKKY